MQVGISRSSGRPSPLGRAEPDSELSQGDGSMLRRSHPHIMSYYPTYAIREDLDEGTARWLQEQQGVGPLELSDVTDVCSCYRVGATLRDEQGSVRGWVEADGNYRLQ